MVPASVTSPVFVSADAAREVFRWQDAIDALQASYARPAEPSSIPPRAIGGAEGAWLRTLPAVPPGGRYFGAKLMGAAMRSATPGVEYVVVLFDRETSRLAAFLDANVITGLRTAATSAAALARIAPATPLRLAVLGSGLEATMHTRAFASIRLFTELSVFSPTPARRDAFAKTMTEELRLPVRSTASAEEAVRGADVVLAAARSRGEQPILYGDWIKPGAAVVSIGSTVPEQREIDVSVVKRSDLIVCDVLDEVLEQTGDMIAAKKAGIDFSDTAIGLTALFTADGHRRVTEATAPLFKSVGSGLQDIVVAELILTGALAAGLATQLPVSFETKK